MTLRLEHDESTVSWERVVDLFRCVGWNERSADDVRIAFSHSTFKVFAFDGSMLIGFGRTVDDGRFYASIVDVLVNPAWQRRGVGSAIVLDLQSRLEGFLGVTLTAALDVQPFYHRLGWRRQTTAMLLPRSEEQAVRNCEDGIE